MAVRQTKCASTKIAQALFLVILLVYPSAEVVDSNRLFFRVLVSINPGFIMYAKFTYSAASALSSTSN
jgi:hypothetical protein